MIYVNALDYTIQVITNEDGEIVVTTDNNSTISAATQSEVNAGGGTWGSITGTISDQTDLNSALYNARASSVVSASSITPDVDSYDLFEVTALSQTLTVNAPTGTPSNGNSFIIKISDNGTSRSIVWNGVFVEAGGTLINATVAGATHYAGFIYNATDSTWDCVGNGRQSGFTASRIPFAQDSNNLTDDSNLTFNSTTKKLSLNSTNIYLPSAVSSIYIGNSIGNDSSTGLYNILIGNDLSQLALADNSNVCIGYRAGKNMTIGAHFNVYIGDQAGSETGGGSENIGIGYRAIQYAYGEDNIGIGFGAGMIFSRDSHASACRNNIFIGYYAGAQSGAYGSNAFVDGSHSIFIGDYTYAPSSTEGAQINIGNSIFVRNNTDSNPVPDEQTGNVGLMIANPTARLHIKASTTSFASLRIPHGAAPTSPNDGDIWTTTAGLFVRINGVTVGPLS